MKKLEELFAELYHLLENWNYIPNPYQVRTRIENDIAALTVSFVAL
jgi:hypothetical protein